MAVPELIRIVSRDSPMALAQVERVRAELTAAHPGVGPAGRAGGRQRADVAGGRGAGEAHVDGERRRGR
ncbi:hydroxymethylbilane synthase, partial [Streptomyces althioticus]